MRQVKAALYIFLLLSLYGEGIFAQPSRPQPNVQAYIERYNELAVSMMNDYCIPASIMLSVAIIESAAGESRNCKLLSNHFGIKTTKKYRIPGTRHITQYKSYPSDTASYRHFCEWLMNKKFYQDICGDYNYKTWARTISRSGYTRTPSAWKTKVVRLIEKYRLFEYDAGCFTTQFDAAPVPDIRQ